MNTYRIILKVPNKDRRWDISDERFMVADKFSCVDGHIYFHLHGSVVGLYMRERVMAVESVPHDELGDEE